MHATWLHADDVKDSRIPADKRGLVSTSTSTGNLPVIRRQESPRGRVGQYILVIRRHRVLLDEDVAALYGVETRVLSQAVKRNSERFPPHFMFELSTVEWVALRSQSQVVAGPRKVRRESLLAVTSFEQALLLQRLIGRGLRSVCIDMCRF